MFFIPLKLKRQSKHINNVLPYRYPENVNVEAFGHHNFKGPLTDVKFQLRMLASA